MASKPCRGTTTKGERCRRKTNDPSGLCGRCVGVSSSDATGGHAGLEAEHPEVVFETDTTSGCGPAQGATGQQEHQTLQMMREVEEAKEDVAETLHQQHAIWQRMMDDEQASGVPLAKYVLRGLQRSARVGVKALDVLMEAEHAAEVGDAEKVSALCEDATDLGQQSRAAAHRAHWWAERDELAGIEVGFKRYEAIRRGDLLEVEGEWLMVTRTFKGGNQYLVDGQPLFGLSVPVELARGEQGSPVEVGEVPLRGLADLRPQAFAGEIGEVEKRELELDLVAGAIRERYPDLSGLDDTSRAFVADWETKTLPERLTLLSGMTLTDYCEHLQRLTEATQRRRPPVADSPDTAD